MDKQKYRIVPDYASGWEVQKLVVKESGLFRRKRKKVWVQINRLGWEGINTHSTKKSAIEFIFKVSAPIIEGEKMFDENSDWLDV